MKVIGIILLGFAALNLITWITSAFVLEGASEIIGQKISGAIMFSILGAFLISRDNNKKKKQEEKDNWDK